MRTILAFALATHFFSYANEQTPSEERFTLEQPEQNLFQQGMGYLRPERIDPIYHRMSYHYLSYISDNGRLVQLEDSSHWEVTSNDRYLLNYWRLDDQLVITPNYSWFASGDYFITNKRDNSYVRANLYTGPEISGPYSHWIIAIDHTSGHVTLENGTTWCIYSSDRSIFLDWEVNDHIIVGLYDNWLHTFDHILINANMDRHVRAKQY